MTFVYQFECKSIQAYILGNRMRAMVGGSEIVEALTGSELDQVIAALALENPPEFARRAGGAIRALFAEETSAQRLSDFWSFWVRSQYPGLKFVHAIVPDSEQADERLYQQLTAARNLPHPSLPLASPFAERAPRTGEPAVAVHPREQRVDAVTKMKLEKGAAARLVQEKVFGNMDYFLPTQLVADEGDAEDEALFPRDGDLWAAVIHIDGNGIGNIYRKLRENLKGKPLAERARHQLALSSKLERATRAAACYALRPLLDPNRTVGGKPFLAARPLVLGGDDVTLITRAADALHVVEAFLRAFQKESREVIDFLKDGDEATSWSVASLTACAGIAYIKAEQPFLKAYQLADSLCQAAKRRLRALNVHTSAIAFHRITTHMIDDWETIVERELQGRNGLVLTMQPYGLEPGCRLPLLQDLRHLEEHLSQASNRQPSNEKLALSRGLLRELLRLLALNPHDAAVALQRLQEREHLLDKDFYEAVKDGFCTLVGPCDTGPFAPLNKVFPLIDAERKTPLGDVMSLCALGGIQ